MAAGDESLVVASTLAIVVSWFMSGGWRDTQEFGFVLTTWSEIE